MERADERQLPAVQSASQPSTGTTGSWMWSHVVAALAQLAAHRETACGASAMFETAPFAGRPTVRPSETKPSGAGWRCGRAPRCGRAESASSGSKGARMRGSWPARASSAASASMWRVTPPGYVHEYGETQCDPHGAALYPQRAAVRQAAAAIIGAMSAAGTSSSTRS